MEGVSRVLLNGGGGRGVVPGGGWTNGMGKRGEREAYATLRKSQPCTSEEPPSPASAAGPGLGLGHIHSVEQLPTALIMPPPSTTDRAKRRRGVWPALLCRLPLLLWLYQWRWRRRLLAVAPRSSSSSFLPTLRFLRSLLIIPESVCPSLRSEAARKDLYGWWGGGRGKDERMRCTLRLFLLDYYKWTPSISRCSPTAPTAAAAASAATIVVLLTLT